MKSTAVDRADVLVIGGGVAGMTAALHAAPRRVILLTKAEFAHGGSSPLAQGGVAVALGPDDSPSVHAADTLAAGAGLSDPAVVRAITGEAPRRIAEIVALGATFDRNDRGELSLGREAAHQRRRILHATGDATGAELVRTLAAAVRSAPHIEVVENQMVIELVLEGNRLVGVVTAGRDGQGRAFSAAAVVLATGGIGHLYSRTTNPAGATGDGIALAARVGARLTGLEFVQFHPTALDDGRDPSALLTEALRGEGAVLLDERGRRFMCDEHELAELAPRDIVARAIAKRTSAGQKVLLDATALDARLVRRFPTVVELCAGRGLDPRSDRLPVVPAAHYHMGGVMTDIDGRTSVSGLWACGEVAHTGMHGANRLASNSLLEALVVGGRCGEAVSRTPALAVRPSGRYWAGDKSPWLDGEREHRAIAGELRDLMQAFVGVERSARTLREARHQIEGLRCEVDAVPGELSHMALVASLVVRAAEARTESRGAHFRADIPCTSSCWRQDLVFVGESMVAPQAVRRAFG